MNKDRIGRRDLQNSDKPHLIRFYKRLVGLSIILKKRGEVMEKAIIRPTPLEVGKITALTNRCKCRKRNIIYLITEKNS